MVQVERGTIPRTAGEGQKVVDMREGVLKDLADYIINQSKGDNTMNDVLSNNPFLD